MIQLVHVLTNTVLLTHDVASPLMPTNQEFTTWARDDTSRYNETLFQLTLIDAPPGEAWKSKSGYFRLIHGQTRVSMWTHNKQLPDWAFRQQEINGNKNPSEKTATWFVDEIIAGERKISLSELVTNHTNRLVRWRRPKGPSRPSSSQGS